MDIKDLVNSILNQDASTASNILDAEMKKRISVLTDIKKKDVATDIFGKQEKEVNQDGTRQ